MTQGLPTGQYDEDEMSDLEQDTKEQNYRDNVWCTFLYGLEGAMVAEW